MKCEKSLAIILNGVETECSSFVDTNSARHNISNTTNIADVSHSTNKSSESIKTPIRISVDAMGGERAPGAAIEAIHAICATNDNTFFLIFGDDDGCVKSLLHRHQIPTDRYTLFESKSVILDNDKPISAMRYSRDSSMRKAIDAVKNKEADACVSCGNTGALMVMARTVLGGLAGIKKPAIIGLFPTLKGKSVMLDLGANTDCGEILLFQYALMGRCFAKAVLKIDNPSIALLNIGVEQFKGREVEQMAFELLTESGINFVGYVEGHDITQGKADVVVTDGFSGNLVLKASEGAAQMCLRLFKAACTRNIRSKLGAMLLRPSLEKSLAIIDPVESNGAMFVGVNGIVVKSHGRSDVAGIVKAIEVAIHLAQNKINEKIVKELHLLEEMGIGLNIVERIKYTSAKIFGKAKNST